MFKNKEEFKTEFSRRLVESYGCDVKDTHPTEKYLTLGTMVRDYASVNWRDCKNAAAAQDVKQVYYFSMEFLLGRMMRTNLKNLGIYDMVVEGLKELGIDNILALRGDIPEGLTFPDTDRFRYAYELVEEIRKHGDFCVGAACYPEGHVENEHKTDDIRYLKQKVDSGVDFLTTQMFFDNDIHYNFLYRIREAGITVPVLPGIMPITSAAQMKKSQELSGTVFPRRFLAILDRFGSSPAAMKQAGIAYATDQIIDLLANGVKNIHIYSMNRPDVAAAIIGNLSDIIKA